MFFEAVTVADVDSRDPKDLYARRGAIIALKSYLQIKNEINAATKNKQSDQKNASEELNSITGQINSTSPSIVNTWADSEEADDAKLILVSNAAEDGKYAEAKKLVDSINPKQPVRLRGEILLGTHATQQPLQSEIPKAG